MKIWRQRRSEWSRAVLLLVCIGALVAFACAREPTPREQAGLRTLVGYASYYGPGFHGNETANGETFDQRAMTAAHRTLPLGTVVRVTNLENGRSVVVRINDRGPYGRNFRNGTIIDLSKGAAQRLRFIQDGLVRVKVEVLRSPEKRASSNDAGAE